jgi:translocation and assembly module TamB
MRALLLLLLALLAAPAFAQQETPEEERSMLLAFIEDKLSAPNRQIRLQGIEGVLSSNARIGSITVADNDGVWLRITDAAIVWSRSTLIFRQRLQIDRLSAARIEVLRRPLPDDSLPAPESSSFRLPELPVAVNLDELDVPSVSFGPGVFGLESELAITGRIRLEDGSLDTALDITRLDGPGGRFALNAAYANATEQLDLDLQLSEPENGVIANLLNIEGRPPVDLAVQGSGPLSGLDIGISLDAGGERVLTGTTALRRQADGLGYDARLSGPIARLVPAQFRAFFGNETALTASGLVRDAGGVVLDALNLDSAALDLAASVETGADGFLRRLNLEASLDNGTAEPVVLPVPGGDTTVQRAALTLSFGETADGEWSGQMSADDIATADFSARQAQLNFGGVATALEDAARRSISFAADGALSGIVAARDDWNEALGDAISLNIDGAWRAGEPVRLARATLSGNGLSASLAGDIADLAFTGDIAVQAASIAPFSGLAGRPLQGALDLKADGTVELIGGGFDLAIDSAAQDLAIGVEAADRLLAGRSTITGRVGRGEDGLTTRGLRIGNDRVELTADGGIASGGADFSYAMSLSDLGLLTPRAAGRLEAEGSAKGAEGLINLTTLARVPSGSLAGKRLSDAQIAFEGTFENGALDGTLGGDAFLDGVRAQLSAGIGIGIRDGEQRITDLDFTAGGARATGALDRNADGLIDGAIRIDAADISTVAALLLVEGAGAVEADIALSHADGAQAATVKAGARGLRIDQTRIQRADIEAAVADLFGVPAIDGTVRAQGIVAGGVTVSTLDATAQTSGDVTRFSADARLENGATARAAGSLAPEDDGYRLALDEASFGQGALVARLAQPASLKVAGDTVAIDALELDVGGGRVTAQGTVAENFDVAVTLARLPLSIANLLRPDLDLGGTLDGEARITGPRANPAARFTLSGDAITAAALREAGQSRLSLTASGEGNGERITINASATTPEGLRASANGAVPLAGGSLAVDFNASAPLALANRFLAERGTQLSGTLEASGSVSGPLSKPSVRAMFSTSGASVVDPEANVRVNDINIMGTVDGDTVTLRSANARLAAGGSISAGGTISLDAAAGFPADLRVALDQARYADGDMVVATVNGNLAIAGALTRDPLLSGRIDVERAEITVPDSFGGGAAAIDVIHRNAPPAVRATLARARANDGTPTPSARPSVMRLDVTVSAPARIFIRGRGLDTEVGGDVRLTGPVTDIQPVGGFRLIRGRLSILGQRITFDEGTVTLIGDLDPYLDFVARSAGNDITVFITVRGRVSDLDIGFSSQPELPEDEVLAQLIFNRSLSELSALQIAQLAAAAAELAGGGNSSLLGSLRSATGLDDLDVVTDSEGNAAVRAGRYIQDNIYLGVEAGAQGTTRGTINLDITEDLKARGGMGSDGDSSLGIFYERDY